LDLYKGNACISLVRVIMRNYRRAPGAPLWGAPFAALKEQQFLNFRTYVRHHGEPGAFFMWGWLSRPLGLPLPDEPLGLTCAFANFREGCITAKGGSLAYKSTPAETPAFTCRSSSIAEFALERYSGFFAHRGRDYVFRAWHEPWLVTSAEAQVEDLSLITNRFPWFERATFVDASYAPLSNPVWLGRAHRLTAHHRSRAFLELP
jgi:uncharacterized protein YqjF (DUF2071 family)